jgi:hypothetical protein
MNPLYKLNIFLNQHRVEKGKYATHLAYPNPGKHRAGRFNIPDKDLDDFYTILTELKDTPVCITEMHLPDRSPVIIDLDFKRKTTIISDDPVKLYSDEDINTFMTRLYTVISKYVNIVSMQKSLAYIMEKPPNKPDSNGLIKGGIHIMLPNLYLPYNILYLIRNDIINDKEVIDMFYMMDLDNSIENIYDKLVIEKNAWMLYNNCKPGSKPYHISRSCKLDKFREINDHICVKFKLNDEKVYMNIVLISSGFMNSAVEVITRRLSIRRDIKVPSKLNISLEKAEQLFQKIKPTLSVGAIPTIKRTCDLQNAEEILVYAKCIVKNGLSFSRADEFELWIDLALCLSSIHPELRDTFIEFSKSSYKYVDEADCDRVWNITPKMNYLDALVKLTQWLKLDSLE